MMDNITALKKYSTKNNEIYITELDEIPGWYCIWNPRNLRMIRNNDNFFEKSILDDARKLGYTIKFNKLPI